MVHFFWWGEAYDDKEVAFYIDETRYPDPAQAEAAVREAWSGLGQLGVISDVEIISGPTYVGSLMTWEQFRQRYLVERQPLPVRPVPSDQGRPPGWDAMFIEMDRAAEELREQVMVLLQTTFPDDEPSLEAFHDAFRQSPGSVYLDEEWYGFEIDVITEHGADQSGAMRRLSTTLRDQGWNLSDIEESDQESSRAAIRGGYRLWFCVDDNVVEISAESPYYRAPIEPGSTWVTAPRPMDGKYRPPAYRRQGTAPAPFHQVPQESEPPAAAVEDEEAATRARLLAKYDIPEEVHAQTVAEYKARQEAENRRLFGDRPPPLYLDIDTDA